MILSKRGFLVGLGGAVSLLAAPSIVRASSLMPVSPIPPIRWANSYHAVSVLRSELVMEVAVDGIPVDFTMLNGGYLEAQADNGAKIIVAIPPHGSHNTDIMHGIRRLD